MVLPVLTYIAVLKGLTILVHALERSNADKDGDGIADNPDEVDRSFLVTAPRAILGPATITSAIAILVRMALRATIITDDFLHLYREGGHSQIDKVLSLACDSLKPMVGFSARLNAALLVVFVAATVANWKTLLINRLLNGMAARGEEGGSSGGKDVWVLLQPLNSLTNWFIAIAAGVSTLQVLGFNTQPLLAVGGASSIAIGIATQQLLTNAVNGISIFVSSPFVAGDSVTLQQGGSAISGVVEKVMPMRTMLLTPEGDTVSIPNKVVSDMIVYNRSRASSGRSTLLARPRQPLTLRIKLPAASLDRIGALQAALLTRLTAAAAGGRNLSPTGSGDGAWEGGSADVATARVEPGSVSVQFSKFTDAGAELLTKFVLLGERKRGRGDAGGAQQLLVELYQIAREHGGTVVS